MHIYIWPSTLAPEACMYDAYIYDPWSWHMCVRCMYLWCSKFVMHGQTLTLMYVSMMHVSMIHTYMLLDPDAWCMNLWCMIHQYRMVHGSWFMMRNFLVTEGWTNEQGDSRMYPWCMYPWSWHMCVRCMYLWCGKFVNHGQTWTLMHIYVMHECTMHIPVSYTHLTLPTNREV